VRTIGRHGQAAIAFAKLDSEKTLPKMTKRQNGNAHFGEKK